MSMITDTHCHLTDSMFSEDRSVVIKRAFDSGIKMINCATDYESSLDGLALIKSLTGSKIFTSIGFDPQMSLLKSFSEEDFRILLKNQRDLIVAIGECGLEFFKQDNFSEQIIILERQILLACEFSLPLIIHCRDFSDHRFGAFKRLISLIDRLRPSRFGVVHCFTGTVEHAEALTASGFYLGFNGIITFDKTGLSERVIRAVDRSKVLIETDSPFLSPAPFRGQRNEPVRVLVVLQKLADIWKVDIEEVGSIVENNAKTLFSLL